METLLLCFVCPDTKKNTLVDNTRISSDNFYEPLSKCSMAP